MQRRFHFEAEQWLPYPPEQVFGFFADPDNLPRLMPDWQRARIESAAYINPPEPPVSFAGSNRIIAGTGTRLTLTVRALPLLPVRLRWDALIEDFRWLHGFCDVQLRGPFTYWRHCHTVTPESRDGVAGTHLRDAVEYAPPLGPLAAVANVLLVRPQLASIFRFRQRRTLELLARRPQPSSSADAHAPLP